MKTIKSLKELQEIYASGKLTKDDPLWLDNDCTYLATEDDKYNFSGGDPTELLEEALDLLGIPHSPV